MTPVADTQARRLAMDLTRSCIVQAPAGSGKTTLLVDRYLALLARVNKPEEVLAITFTRKAAGEMVQRVRTAIAADHPIGTAVRERDRQLGWRLLDQPGRLRIQTIDSFCLGLLSALPAGGTITGFTEDAAELYGLAVDRLFQRPFDDHPLSDGLIELLSYHDNDYGRARASMIAMLERRDQWLEIVTAVSRARHGNPERLDATLRAGVDNFVTGIVRQAQSRVADALLTQLAGFVPDAEPYTLAFWQRLAGLVTTRSGALRRRIGLDQGIPEPERRRQLVDLIEQLREAGLSQTFRHLRTLPEALDLDREQDRLFNLSLVLSLAALSLSEVFEDGGSSDFTELVIAARGALSDAAGPSDLALALDYQIQHLLVDEFQDTSMSQYRLIEQLVEGWQPGDGRSLFLVGDPMQSIYRFRHADVGLFYRVQQSGLGAVALEDIRLTSNFRSAPAVVDWVNATFSRVLAGPRYDAMTKTRTDMAGSGVWAYAYDSRTAQLAGIAERIRTLRAEHPSASIAVLARTRGHLNELAPALQALNITWQASDVTPLADAPVARDLMSLARVLARPRDRLARYALLRGRLVGLGLKDLERLPAAAFGGGPDRPGAFARLSPDGRRRLARVAPELTRWRRSLHELPPRATLEGAWLALGGTQAYPAADLIDAERVFQAADGLDELDPRELERVLDARFVAAHGASNVHAMTMHKAKGLEFDHVLLPQLDRAIPPPEQPLMLWRAGNTPGDSALVFAPRTDYGFYRWLAHENALLDDDESTRLLYVACTRAVVGLHLFATTTPRPTGRGLYGKLAEHVRFERPPRPNPPPVGQPELFRTPVPTLRLPAEFVRDMRGLPDDWADPALGRSEGECREPVPIASQTTMAQTAATPDTIDRVNRDHIGAHVRRLLVGLAAEADPGPSTMSVVDTWLAVNVPDRTLATRIRAHVARLLDDPDGRWLLGRHARADTSAAFTVVARGGAVRVTADRTFVAPGGIWWLVDYDVTAVSGAATETNHDAFAAGRCELHRARHGVSPGVLAAVFEMPVQTAVYLTSLPRLCRLDLFAPTPENSEA